MHPSRSIAPGRGRELRGEARDPVFGVGVLTWDEGYGARQAQVEVCNISNSGAQVFGATELPAGSKAYLTGDQFRCVGTVRYCQAQSAGFMVGLEFSLEPNDKDALGF